MITYNEDWIIPIIFRLEGSVMVRASLFAIPASFLALIFVFLDEWYPEFRDDYKVGELQKTQLWSASTFVLTILLGFRTNRAMARFWEGTGLLHQMRGEWFDSVSCCVTFSRAAVFQKRTEVMMFRHTIVRLMSLCHGSALEEIAGDNAEECETIDSFGLDNKTLQYLKECKEDHHFNRVEVLLHMIQSLITKNLDDGVLKIPPPILSRVYQTLSRGFVNLLNAKKIADTRFPFPFVQLITMLLVMHVVVTPLIIAAICPSRLWAPIFTFVPIFACFYLNFVGVELENPFGTDANDLPLDHFQAEMNKCLLMLLQDNADLIPGVSHTRCVTNFQEIKTTMRPSGVYDKEEYERAHPVNKRLSNFSEYVDIFADEEFCYDEMSLKFSPTSTPLGGRTMSIPDSVEEGGASGVDEGGASANLDPLSSTYTDQITEREMRKKESDASCNVLDASELVPPALLPAPTVAKSLSNDVLSRSMIEFNNALQDLKKSAETQVQDLNRSISAAKDFSNTLPTLLDTLAMGHARQQAYALEDRNARILPVTPSSPNKPLLSGPMTSTQMAPVQIDRQDCPIVS